MSTIYRASCGCYVEVNDSTLAAFMQSGCDTYTPAFNRVLGELGQLTAAGGTPAADFSNLPSFAEVKAHSEAAFAEVTAPLREAAQVAATEAKARQHAEAAARRDARDAALARRGRRVCERCNGAGGWRGWPGYTCYRCRGEGSEPIPERARC